MSRLTRDGTTEPVSRDKILRRERGQRKVYFPCSPDHEQDWQTYPFDPYSAIFDDHIYYQVLYTYCRIKCARVAWHYQFILEHIEGHLSEVFMEWASANRPARSRFPWMPCINSKFAPSPEKFIHLFSSTKPYY